MSRVPIPLYVTDQIMTVGHANIFWRGNELASWTYQNAGDMTYASGLDTLGKLECGGNAGKIVKTNYAQTAPEVSGLLYAYITSAADQSFTSSVWEKVEMDTVVVNVDNCCDTPHKFIAPFRARWLFLYGVTFASNANGLRSVDSFAWHDEEGMYLAKVSQEALNAAEAIPIYGIRSDVIGVDGEVSLYGYQNSGDDLSMTNAWMAVILQRGYT